VDPASKIFAKLVHKNAKKTLKGVAYPKNVHDPNIPSLPKIGETLMDPTPWIFKLCESCS
jgi:hypothetical protein